MLQAEEELLVLAAQEGSHDAFNQLVQYFQKPLLMFAYKLSSDMELSRDAVQDSWIRLAGRLGRLDDPRAFKSWIYRTVRWRVLDLLRTRKTVQIELDDICCEANQNHDNLAVQHSVDNPQADNQQVLTVAINQLPAIERQIIYLFYLDEMKLIEIAFVLDIPLGTVKSRLNRARKMLKEKFS
ncbi:RNA polymerase sigma factor [Aliikangiella maris]|uniref:Sigma-70 family RNA polymerase sigma factor n=2 Tax=Aliikangiella maris TaxID=3162458 RepID=A0ABV3MUS4_9GAMM